MAHDSRNIFVEVTQRLEVNPSMRLYELARLLGCSHPIIEKAVLKHSSLTFRDFQKRQLLEMGMKYLKEGHKVREIGSFLGYRWSEDFLRLVRTSTGSSLRELSQNHFIIKKAKTGGR